MLVNIRYYDKTLGQSRKLAGELRLISERMTAKDLLERRISEDMAAESRDNAEHLNLIHPRNKETKLNGARTFGVATQDRLETRLSVAITALNKGTFIMLLDDRQVTSDDELVTLKENSAVTFIKLVPLVGG
jgi:hypothetical protein